MSKTPAPLTDYDRLNAVLGTRKMSIRALETACEFSTGVIGHAAKRGPKMSLDMAVTIATILEVKLADLIGAHDAETVAAATGSVIVAANRVPLNDIAPSMLNPRKTFDADEIDALAESIAVNGLLQNLVVRVNPDRWDGNDASHLLIAGERRWRALNQLAMDERLPADIAENGVPVKIVNATEAEHIALAILENLQRKDVNPMEEAEGFAALQAMDPGKYTTTYIAEQIGVTPRMIQQRLQLVKRLGGETQTALRNGGINVAQARALASAAPRQQQAMLDKIVTGQFANSDDLQRAIRNDWKPVEQCVFDVDDPKLAEHLVTGEDGKRFFAGIEKYRALQEKAAKARLVTAKARFASAELVGWFHREQWAPGLADPVEKGACVIHHESWSGKVAIYEGLLPRPEAEETNGERHSRDRRSEINGTVRAERKEQMEAFGDALSARIKSRDAIRLLLVAAISEGRPGTASPLDHYSMYMPTALVAGGPCKVLADLCEDDGDGLVVASDSFDDGDLFEAILNIDDAALSEALAGVVGSMLNLPLNQRISPALMKYAQREGIDVPPLLMLDYDGVQDEIARRMAAPDPQTDIEDAIAAQDAPVQAAAE